MREYTRGEMPIWENTLHCSFTGLDFTYTLYTGPTLDRTALTHYTNTLNYTVLHCTYTVHYTLAMCITLLYPEQLIIIVYSE